MRFTLLAVLTATAVILASPAYASITLFDQTGDRLGGALVNDPGVLSDFAGGNPNGQAADDFTFTTNTTINEVVISGSYNIGGSPLGGPSGPAESFIVRFFANDNASTPERPLSPEFVRYDVANVVPVDTGIDLATVQASDVFEYTIPIPDTVFNANEQFWVSVQRNSTPSDLATGAFFWVDDSAGLVGNSRNSIFGSPIVGLRNTDLSFSLGFRAPDPGAIPEPFSFVVWAGLASAVGLHAGRRVRRH